MATRVFDFTIRETSYYGGRIAIDPARFEAATGLALDECGPGDLQEYAAAEGVWHEKHEDDVDVEWLDLVEVD